MRDPNKFTGAIYNSTYCVYLLDLRQLYFDESIVTINDVIEEVKHERSISIEAHLVPAKKTYLSTATVAKQFLLQYIDELKVVNARRHGYSIRKISEMYNIAYSKVLEILHMTQVDIEDKEVDAYVEETMKTLAKRK